MIAPGGSPLSNSAKMRMYVTREAPNQTGGRPGAKGNATRYVTGTPNPPRSQKIAPASGIKVLGGQFAPRIGDLSKKLTVGPGK
jgi:hypothetical protein